MDSPSAIQPELRQMAARLATTEFVDPSSPLFEKKLDILWFELQESLGKAMAAEHVRREKAKEPRSQPVHQISRPDKKVSA